MKWLLLIIAGLLLWPSQAQGRERLFGYCEDGHQTVLTANIPSTTFVQRSYPPCRITVYAAGTTNLINNLCSDNLGSCTALGNPFTSTTTGYWFFYPRNGRYDVKFDSVGIAGCPAGVQCIATPYTHGDYLACDPQDSSDPAPCGAGAISTAMTRRLAFWYAGVNNGSAAASFDLPTSNAMVVDFTTDATNGTVQGVLKAAKSSVAYFSFLLPSDFVAFTASTINFTTVDTTQNDTIIFQLATACSVPNTNTVDNPHPAYNALQNYSTATIGAGAVSGAQFSATIPTVTSTGCAAGNVLHIKLTRSGADTSTDTAVKLIGDFSLFYTGTIL